jgi:hypothetical protein
MRRARGIDTIHLLSYTVAYGDGRRRSRTTAQEECDIEAACRLGDASGRHALVASTAWIVDGYRALSTASDTRKTPVMKILHVTRSFASRAFLTSGVISPSPSVAAI